jgi:myo-inositol-1(or 4)-monophosphatase
VAEGTVDLFWQFGLAAWDVAAGMVLTREAGAEVRILNPEDDWLAGGPIDMVVAAPSLVDEALEVGLPLLNNPD